MARIKSRTFLQNNRRLKRSHFGHIKRHEMIRKHILEAKIIKQKRKRKTNKKIGTEYRRVAWIGTTITQAQKCWQGILCFPEGKFKRQPPMKRTPDKEEGSLVNRYGNAC